MDGISAPEVVIIVIYLILVYGALKKYKDEGAGRIKDEIHALEKAEIVSEPKSDTDDDAPLEPKSNPVEDAVIWVLRWFILKPLFWIAYVGFFIGSLAALFAAIANIIHFNILAAIGFCLLYMLLWEIWKQLEYHRILTKLWREAFSSGISKNLL